MPTTPATVARTSWRVPSPRCSMHTIDVVDAHAAVLQLLAPTVAVGVVALSPKLSPLTVTLYPAVTAALASATKLTAGAEGRDNQRAKGRCKPPCGLICPIAAAKTGETEDDPRQEPS